MTPSQLFVYLTFLAAVNTSTPLAQNIDRNPREGDPGAIRIGYSLFQTRCADCHGIDAKGVLGPDLTGMWAAGATDRRLFQTIQRGVPGSQMPPSSATDDELWSILAYLRTLSIDVSPEEFSSGDAARGGRIFDSMCSRCHRVNGRGGYLGPDLSRIGASRSRATLTREIREATAFMAPGFRSVTLVTLDGRNIRGLKKAEDAFSIQIMDAREQFQGYLKADLRDVKNESRSMMPDFGTAQLDDNELNDLIRFLGTLRGINAERR